jgi:hypothetical protein
MAAAALAYKCMEVAYMRVVYFSHTSASRDRHELQTALQMVPPGNYNLVKLLFFCGNKFFFPGKLFHSYFFMH